MLRENHKLMCFKLISVINMYWLEKKSNIMWLNSIFKILIELRMKFNTLLFKLTVMNYYYKCPNLILPLKISMSKSQYNWFHKDWAIRSAWADAKRRIYRVTAKCWKIWRSSFRIRKINKTKELGKWKKGRNI